jgi:hypothetical protein
MGAVNEDPMNTLLGDSITYRVAVSPHQGRKIFTLRTQSSSGAPFGDQVGNVVWFLLHAEVVRRGRMNA